MGSRPEFSIAEFVRVRREFDDGRGPAATWARLNTLSLWRLDELAERAGSRTWAMLVAPPDLPQTDRQGERLVQALRSAQVAAAALPMFWRFEQVRISTSYVVVAHQAKVQQALRLAQRYDQIAVVDVQRIPFERVVVHDVAAEHSAEMDVFEPRQIADTIAQVAGADCAAVQYVAVSLFEALALHLAEQRVPR